MQEKLVSVCINAYNAKKYILKTIESVINQTYKNLQIIVVDDCSTDSTYDLIKSVKDERIKVYKTPFNGHMSFACNEALKHAKGDYIAHLDADDLWVPEKIEKQVAFLEEHPEYGACFTHIKVNSDSAAREDGRADYFEKVFAFENMPHSKMYRFFYDNLNPLCHSSVLMRKSAVEKVGSYDASTLYLQDFDYWMRLITFFPIYIICEPLTIYTVHSENNSNMGEADYEAHDTESVRIFYKSLNLCPDSLFLEAFYDKLKLKGEHTHEEVEIEKALLLSNGTFAFKANPILGIYKFSELFQDEKYIKLATEKFKFTTRELYKLYHSPAYHNFIRTNQLKESIAELHIQLRSSSEETELLRKIKENTEQQLEEKNQQLEEKNQQLKEISLDLQNAIIERENYKHSFEEIKNSFFWRATHPFRYVIGKIKKILR